MSLFPLSTDFTAGHVGSLMAKYEKLMYICMKRNFGVANKMPDIDYRTCATLLLMGIT